MTETGGTGTGVPAGRTLSEFLHSPAVKLFAIGALILVLLIPITMVWVLLGERRSRADDVTAEVSQSWGDAQRLAGPVLVVPYRYASEVHEGDQTREVVNRAYAVFLPDALEIAGAAKSEALRRSIFTVPVYRADLTLKGRFGPADPADLLPPRAEPLWSEAWLAVGVSDVRAFKENVLLAMPGREDKLPFQPTMGFSSDTLSGIHVGLPQGAAQAGFPFEIHFVLNGSSRLTILPFGGETKLSLSSDWPHPSFTGPILPDERHITAKGFEARWTVPNLARSIPQRFTLTDQGFSGFERQAFGVEFFQSVDFYQLVARSLKYAILFIGVVFAAAFLLELLSERRLHLVQYLFIGFAQAVFYLLLLSLSEHLGFEAAYCAAAAATILLVAVYASLILASLLRGFVMFSVLLLVYGLLYLLLRLEDYALLVGSLAVFAFLAATMFLTLNVDWSSGRRRGT